MYMVIKILTWTHPETMMSSFGFQEQVNTSDWCPLRTITLDGVRVREVGVAATP